MPILTKHQIVRITDVMLQAGGASAGHAGIVADHLAQANLTGYDSHGFIRIPQYLKNIEDGDCNPKAETEVVGNHGGILQINWPMSFPPEEIPRIAIMKPGRPRPNFVRKEGVMPISELVENRSGGPSDRGSSV